MEPQHVVEGPPNDPRRKRAGTLIFVLWLIASTGVVIARVIDRPLPGELLFRAPFGIMLLVLTVAAVFVTIGGKFMSHPSVRVQYKAYGLLLSGMLGAFLMIPGLLLNYVSVTQSGFVAHDTFWFHTSHDEVRFDDVKRLDLHSDTSPSNPMRTLMCMLKNHRIQPVNIGWIQPAALDAILTAAQARGVDAGDARTALALGSP